MEMIKPTKEPALSGERFSVLYRIAGGESLAMERARDILIEQTVEFPAELVPEGKIHEEILGRIESFERAGGESLDVRISFCVESAGNELPQLLNVVFGNISMKPGIRVMRLHLSEKILSLFRGPRFGIPGLRKLLNVRDRPLLCTALKPMGLCAQDLAELAYRFARGGMDIIKDDHGLANQSFSAFSERVKHATRAVRRANDESGGKTIYAPNISGAFDEIRSRALFAKEAGAGALLVSPGLVGFDTMRAIAEDDSISLPVIAHPAFLGSYALNHESGISHFVLFGQLARLAGADASIFPNFGGRFSYSPEECRDIAAGCAEDMGRLKKIFPAPGGGMSLERVPGMMEFYGRGVIFLIGGGLFQVGDDLVENCRLFRRLVEPRQDGNTP